MTRECWGSALPGANREPEVSAWSAWAPQQLGRPEDSSGLLSKAGSVVVNVAGSLTDSLFERGMQYSSPQSRKAGSSAWSHLAVCRDAMLLLLLGLAVSASP